MQNASFPQPRSAIADTPEATVQAGFACASRGEWSAARTLLERVAEEDSPFRQPARFLLWEVCQAMRDPAAGIAHLRDAVRETPLTQRGCAAPQRRVLAINVPGDFQANLPVAPLLDPATTELYTFWLADPAAMLADPVAMSRFLPAFDCAFVAIAEDRDHAEALRAADALVDALGVPAINRGATIGRLSRDGAAVLLQDVPDAIVPRQRRVARARIEADPASWLRDCGLAFPIIMRPDDSHAGTGLERLVDDDALRFYLDRHPDTQSFFAAPFVDYRSADGLWRKYRIIFVEGRPFPFHLAIHDDWAIWYYNAGMDADAGKRSEEARFLVDLAQVFPARALDALDEIQRRVGLDYFGLDCGLLPDGTLVVFEVETGMMVHAADDPALYPYKRNFVSRIFHAVERMIDRRIARGPLAANA